MAFKLSNLLNPVTEPNSPSPAKQNHLTPIGGPGAKSDNTQLRCYDDGTRRDHVLGVESSNGTQDAAQTLAFFASGGHCTSRSGSFAVPTAGTNYASSAIPGSVGSCASSGTSEKPKHESAYFQGPHQQSSSLQQLQHHIHREQHHDRVLPPLPTSPPRIMAPASSDSSSPVLPPLAETFSPDRVLGAEHPRSESSHSSDAIEVRYTPHASNYDLYNVHNTGETTESDSIAGVDDGEEEDEDELPVGVSGVGKHRGRSTSQKTKGKARKTTKRQTSPSRPKNTSPAPGTLRSSTTPSTTAHTPIETSGVQPKKRQTAKGAPRKKGVAKPTKKKRRVSREDGQDPEDPLLVCSVNPNIFRLQTGTNSKR